MRLLIGLLLLCNIALAQDSTLVIDTKPITQREVYNDVKGVLKSLADGLTTTSEHVYGALVKQAIAEGLTSLIFEILFITIFATILANTAKFQRWAARLEKEDNGNDADDAVRILYWVLIVIFGISTIISLTKMPTAITQIISPEYYAIKQVLSLLNPNGCH